MSPLRSPGSEVLIRGAELYGAGLGDLRIREGRIAALGTLRPTPGEAIIDARGGALLPGLHDHHIHLLSYAASLASLRCGPPEILGEADLISALQRRRAREPGAWIRGYGYHESVAGKLDRGRLDRWVPDTPVRIQHRSGRLWILNSAAIARLQEAQAEGDGDAQAPAGLENGQLYDQDAALRPLLRTGLPDVAAASRRLASWGVTGLTDMTPENDSHTLRLLGQLQTRDELLQRVHLAGSPALDGASEALPCATPAAGSAPTLNFNPTLGIGPTKVHLHEAQLPPFQDLCESVSRSHQAGRPVAVHCVTETELVYTLAAFRESGTRPGDRIEHASVTPPALLDQLQELGLLVVTQPNFVAERGDAYRRELPREVHPWLYRCRSLLVRGIPLAAGTDAPFGNADPWYAMRAAVCREDSNGAPLGPAERLSADEALALFLGAATAPGQPRRLQPGTAADLCLLDRSWAAASAALRADCVRATFRGGELIYDGVDQTPLEGPRS